MKSTIYYNGSIVTMDDKDAEKIYEAVMVTDGIIYAIGTNAEILNKKSDDTLVINLGGRTMLPAFLDSHSHLTMVANNMTTVPLNDCKTMEEIVDALSSFKKEHQLADDAWIFGFGYDNNKLPDFAHPTADILDKVSKTNPILLAHVSGHLGVVNSKLLEIAGINENTTDPQGGHIGRNSDGKPTGYLEENCFMDISKKAPPITAEQFSKQFVAAQKYYASYGITTVQDGMAKPQSDKMLEGFAEAGLAMLDIVSYMDVNEADKSTPATPYDYKNNYRCGGFKLFLDGSPQGRTAWMSEPYLGGEVNYCGYPIYTDEQVTKLITTAIKSHRQLLTHCNGDAACEQLIRCYSKVKAELASTEDLRPVMVHAQTVRKDQLERMAELGMIASFFVAHTYFWGDVHIRNFGEDRGNHISPVHSAIERNVCYTFHQDSPVTPPDMLLSVWAAVNRVSVTGNSIGADERISVMEALRAVTINAAYQYFEESTKGSITVGKHADFVILSANPLTVPPMDIKNIVVEETIKNGITIYKKA